VEDKDIIEKFGDYQAADVPWRVALRMVGYEEGLLDVDCKPKNKWAANIVKQGRRVRSRREILEVNRYQKALIAQGVLPAC
jgi:hypothetical protein